VGEPLVLISGLPRTGGTFLNQLLDHHPQIWSHPHELNIGFPEKWNWPQLDPSQTAEQLWERLKERSTAQFSRQPFYDKGSSSSLPIVISEQLQRQLFLLLRAQRSASEANFARGVLNDCFSSYFLAYLDCQRRYTPGKRYVVGHASMAGLDSGYLAGFFEAYPDGWIIQTLRQPLGWYRSIQCYPHPERLSLNRLHFSSERLGGSPPGIDDYLSIYRQSLGFVRESVQRYKGRILVLTLEQLVKDTSATIEALAGRLQIDLHPSLVQQTFNGMPILPNSSHARPGAGPAEVSAAERAAVELAQQAYSDAVEELCGSGHGR
jgi:hypothetical protein